MSAKIELKSDVLNRKCESCGYIFSKRSNLLRHIKSQHNNDDLKNVIISLKKQVEELTEKQIHRIEELEHKQTQQIEKQTHQIEKQTQQIEKQTQQIEKQQDIEKHIEQLHQNQIIGNQEIQQLKQQPHIINNVLQVVCITQNDNYLDMLTEELGDFNKALEYIKSCALGHINGDCKLIEKIYLNKLKPDFYYKDKAKTKIEYFNEKQELSIDKKQQFIHKLANNLQNSYLKGINHVIIENLDHRRCPNKLLEEYDIQTWNQHIYNLSDLTYQKKIINQLNIPTKV